MTLENVTKDIVQVAQDKRKAMEDQAQKEIETLKQRAKDEVLEYKKQVKENTNNLKQKIQRKVLSGARFESQRTVLHAKKEIIEEVKENILNEITSMKAKEKRQFLSILVSKAQKEIKVARVRVNLKDSKFLPKEISFKECSIKGGIIAENKNSTIRVNYSVEEIIEVICEKEIIALSEVLF